MPNPTKERQKVEQTTDRERALVEAARAVIAGMERPGSRAEYFIGPAGEIWHDYHEVTDDRLNALSAALSQYEEPKT